MKRVINKFFLVIIQSHILIILCLPFHTQAFYPLQNFLGIFNFLSFSDYEKEVARQLLKQESFGDYFLVNMVGGKSWRVKGYFVGFFATINNVFNQEFKTGGFEDSRYADYRKLSEEAKRNTPIFGSRYFSGYGRTYYINFFVRF